MLRPMVTVTALVALLFVFAHVADAAEIKVLNKKGIYAGNPRTAESPATLRVRAVFANLEPYQIVKKKRIKKGSTRYWVYLTKANKLFRAHLWRYKKNHEYDLIGEPGSFSVEGSTKIPDITKDFLEFMSAPKKESR